MSNGLKKCGNCKEYLNKEEFNKNCTKKDGLDNICKDCRNTYNRKYYEDNAEYYREYQKQYRQDNSDYYREYQKQYRQDRKHNFIYFIVEGKRIMYIGSTINDLSFRISQHVNCYSNIRNYMKQNRWSKIKYISIDDDEITDRELRFIESVLIEEICPILNKVIMSKFDDIDEDRLQYLSEVAYEYLDNLENYIKTYKVNYSLIEA